MVSQSSRCHGVPTFDVMTVFWEVVWIFDCPLGTIGYIWEPPKRFNLYIKQIRARKTRARPLRDSGHLVEHPSTNKQDRSQEAQQEIPHAK